MRDDVVVLFDDALDPFLEAVLTPDAVWVLGHEGRYTSPVWPAVVP